MIYQNLETMNSSIIPQDLLYLFILYRKNILENSENLNGEFVLKDPSEEYIITNHILNTPKSEKTFCETLFNFIDNSNYSDIEVYKKADINRRLFSKIKSNNEYHPSFGTLTSLALTLELSTGEYDELLKSAAYALPLNSYINITLKYCFDNKIYDLNEVNNLIFTVAHKTLKDL